MLGEVCVCVEHVYQEAVASTTATRCFLVCCWYVLHFAVSLT